MTNLSRKNIQTTLHDIRHPKTGPRAVSKLHEPPKYVSNTKIILVVLTLGLFIGLSGYGLYASGFLDRIAASVNGFGSDTEEETAGDLALSSDQLFKLPSFFGDITNIFSAIRGIGSGVNDLNTRGLALLLDSTGGEEFIEILKRIRDNLAVLNKIGFNVGGQVSKLVPANDENTKEFLSDTKNLEKGLSAIISFLDVQEERRIAILFENHSEIRPSGGFVGSYGEVILDKGSVKSIKVDDIYTPDRNAKYKIVPPIQLQTVTTGWGARDANWFFDFPTSAEKILELLEASEIYVHDGIKFDGAIALNANVVSDILAVVGPIYVPEYDVTLTSENFLFAVRDEVESAREANPKENPKQILDLIAPTIIERMQSLSEDAKMKLIGSLIGRAYSKDLKLYFRDDALEELIEQTSVSGSVYAIPEVFNGDYLAVVNANVAGGKTDIFIDQSIKLESTITPSGFVVDDLKISRRHFGNGEEEELYRRNNQNFIKVFTPEGALLKSAVGITPKNIEPKIDYKAEGYSVDQVLAGVESTREIFQGLGVEKYFESGKNVFAAWFSKQRGESRTLELVYERKELFVGNGAKYQFVFDKQSGVESSLDYSVNAPSGYVWRENGMSQLSFNTDVIPGRLVINLTLVKQE